MRRKVKKSLTLFMASVMVVSLLCSRELAVFAEDAGTVGQTVLETEESVTEELVTEESLTEPPVSSEEIWDDQTAATVENDETMPHNSNETMLQETDVSETFVATEWPEQSITAVVYDSQAVITLNGKMPEDAVAEAYPVTVDIEGQNVLAAYDITIYDAAGNVFQPEAGAIRVEIADAAVTEALGGNEDVSVYHMENADAHPQLVEGVNTENQVVAFDAESFSIYAVTTPENHYTCTYNFYNGDLLVNTQILSAGETLIEPETPDGGEHEIFNGWYTMRDGGERFSGFGEVQEALTSSRTIDLYAQFKEGYYVFYKASTALDSKVLYTQTYSDGASILTEDVPFNTGDVNKALIGWSTDPTADAPDETLTINGEDVTLYPVVKAAHWITYDSQDGSAVEPTYVLNGEHTKAPADPTRTGYSFGGWYVNSECTETFQFGSTLDGNITLYAKWNPDRTSYTVIFWKQQVTDDKNASDDAKKYDYEASEIRQANTGSEVSVTRGDRRKGYTGFVYNSEKQTTAVVAADGSTILNVYYDRQLMTYEFYTGRNHATKSYTFTGLYGSTLAANGYTWPSETYSWYYGNDKTTMTFLDAFLFQEGTGTATTIKFYSQDKKDYAVLHYKEALDGSWVLANTSYGGGGTFNFSNKYTGFTVSSYRKYSSSWWGGGSWGSWQKCQEGGSVSDYTKLEIRHSRNSYTLDYSNGTAGVVKSESIKYEQSLDGYAGYVPERPAGLEEYYEFQGWYKDPECTEAFDFSQTMPSNNLVVYAKWAPKQVTVTFDMNAGESAVDEVEPQIFDAGKTADKPENPTREGYSFAGWTRNGEPFNFNTRITEDTTLTAQWISDAQYRITYEPGSGTGNSVWDNTFYVDGAEAKLLEVPEEWTAPEGSGGFVGWTDSEGNIYYAVDTYTMPAHDVVLTARWDKERSTTLTYDFNGGVDAEGQTSVTVNIDVPNSEYAIAGPEVSKDGYELIGWTVASDGTGTLLKNGDKIQVDTLNPESNILYAKWRRVITPPTGIVRNVFPFIVMVVIAVEAMICFAVLYLKKRIR